MTKNEEPKDKPDEQPDVELDEDTNEEAPEEPTDEPEAEDEDEDESDSGEDTDGDESADTDDQPADDFDEDSLLGDDGEAAEDSDEISQLPDDPKVLKGILRARLTGDRRSEPDRKPERRPPPTDEDGPEGELARSFERLAKRDPDAARIIAHVVNENRQRSAQAELERQNERAMEAVPEKHRKYVDAIRTRFQLPTAVAHGIFKGVLYDKLQERKRAREKRVDDTPAETKPARKGSAPITRPVRRAPEPPAAGGGGTIVVAGLRVNVKQTASSWSQLLDRLDSKPALKNAVYKARKAGQIHVD